MTENSVDLLLEIRRQLTELMEFADAEAGSGEYELVPDFTGGTICGIKLAIDVIDGNLALLTRDRAAIAEIFARAQEPLPGSE